MSQVDWSKAPEGATHWDCRQFVSPSFMRKPEGSTHWMFYGGGEWHPYGSLVDTEEAKLIKRPQPWTSEGLPPVGAVCEWKHIASETWHQAKVNYIGCAYVIFASHSGDDEQHYYLRDISFRPARTPEQIAAEERKAGIAEIFRDLVELPWHNERMAEGLYDAGYRKLAAKEN